MVSAPATWQSLVGQSFITSTTRYDELVVNAVIDLPLLAVVSPGLRLGCLIQPIISGRNNISREH